MSNNNPNNLDPKVKNQLINQNTYNSGYGYYKICPTNNSVRFQYSSCNPTPIDAVTKIIVIHRTAVDVVSTLVETGLNSLASRDPIPVIMYPMGNSFTGTNFESREGIYDENIILRTNYTYVTKKQMELYPIKKSTDVIYSNPITAIRDNSLNALDHDNVFKMAVITVCPILEIQNSVNQDQNAENNNVPNKLSSSDLLKLQMLLETVFQAGICGCHNVLILTIFTRQFDIPIDDQIMLFNLCIMKYGHKYKSVIVAIPHYEPRELFEYFETNIIKPQLLVRDIDSTFDGKIMAAKLHNEIKTDTNADDKVKIIKKMIKNNKAKNKLNKA